MIGYPRHFRGGLRVEFLRRIGEMALDDPTVARAMCDPLARLVVLGGFSQLLPSHKPGWLVEVKTRYGSEFRVAMRVADSPNLEHRVYRYPHNEPTPWQYWVGQLGREWNIYDGDIPIIADARRSKCISQSVQS